LVDLGEGFLLKFFKGVIIMRRSFFLLAVLLIGHFPMQSSTAADQSPPVVLGGVYNLTGRQSVLDKPSVNGALLATKETNAEGGVLGRPVELVVVDGESVPDTVASRTAGLIDGYPTVAALFGLSDTDMALAAGRAAAKRGRLFLTSGATSPKLPLKVEKFLYLACFGDNVQAAVAAEWAYKNLKARTASIVFNSERTYTQLLHSYFQARFERLGGRVVSSTSYKVGSMTGIADNLKPADIIFLASEETGEAVAGARILRQAGFMEPILGGDGYDTPSMWAEQPDLKDIYYTTHAFLAATNPNPLVTSFRQAYMKAYSGQEPDSFAALGYDAVRLLINAVFRAGIDDPVKVRSALAMTSGFRGVTGIISFDGDSEIPRKSVTVLSVTNGKVLLVEEVLPDRVPIP